jgi:O-antigen/teichoic acid export membrane protein
LVPLAVLAAAVLTLWVGPEAANGGAQLLSTLVLGGIVGSGSNVFVYYAMGMGRNAPVAFISVLYSVLTVIFTVLLIKTVGPLAAGGGLLVASVVRVLASLVITRRSFFPGLGWRELAISTVLPLVAGVAIALGAQGVDWGQIHGWIHLVFLYVALSATVLAVTVGISVLTATGRDIVIRISNSLRTA